MPKIAKPNRNRLPEVAGESLEVRFFTRAVEIGQEGEAPKIRGYAAVFNAPAQITPRFREQVAPGAFRSSLTGGDVRALLNHDPNYVLGRTSAGSLRLWEDDTGLRFEVDPPDTQWARDLLVTMRRGDISQGSFGFRVRTQSWDADESLRTLQDVELHDVSVVTFPAYPQTSCHVLGDIYDKILAGTLGDDERIRLRAHATHLLTVTGADRDELDLLRRRLALSEIP